MDRHTVQEVVAGLADIDAGVVKLVDGIDQITAAMAVVQRATPWRGHFPVEVFDTRRFFTELACRLAGHGLYDLVGNPIVARAAMSTRLGATDDTFTARWAAKIANTVP